MGDVRMVVEHQETPQHWTLDMADRVAEMVKRMRAGRVPERYIDQAVAKYLETTKPEEFATPPEVTA